MGARSRDAHATPLTTDAARPRVLPQRVDHRAPDPALGEGFEFDASRFVEAVRRVDEPDYSVLDEVANVDRVRHRCRNAAGELLHERETGYNAGVLSRNLRAHHMSSAAE